MGTTTTYLTSAPPNRLAAWPLYPKKNAFLAHEPALPSTRAPGHQGTKAPGNQGTRAPGHQGTRAPGHQGTRAPGHQAAELLGVKDLGKYRGSIAELQNGRV